MKRDVAESRLSSETQWFAVYFNWANLCTFPKWSPVMDERNQCCLFFFLRGTFVWTAVCLDTKGRASQSLNSFKLYWLLEVHGKQESERKKYTSSVHLLCTLVCVCVCVCAHVYAFAPCLNKKLSATVHLHAQDFTFQQLTPDPSSCSNGRMSKGQKLKIKK